MSSNVERISRDTGGPIDVESLKRKSWSGFSAEFVRIPGPTHYDFRVRGSWAHLLLFDLYRTDGETVLGDGQARIRTKDLRNKMIFAPPGCPIDGWSTIEKSGCIMTLAISPDIQHQLGLELNGLPAKLGFEDRQLRAEVQRFQALLDDPSSDTPGYAESIMELLIFDLARVSRKGFKSKAPIGALDPHQMQLITDYIDAHLSLRSRIAELATLLNLTPAHFMRSFELATGVTPHQYVITRRLHRAKQLLAEGNHSIANVAAETGFGTSIQLARAFRRATGTTPSEYRRYSG